MNINKIRCLIPFQAMQFCTYGFVRSCCPSWTKVGPVGNLSIDHDIMAIWNSPRMQKIRKAVIEGKLDRVCNTGFCPYAVMNKEIDLEAIETEDINLQRIITQVRAGKTELETGPLSINLSDSGDCNLRCKMCRANDAFYRKDPENTRLLYSEMLPAILPTASYMDLTGNGDPFFRRDTREFMQSTVMKERYPHLKLQIITNAQLFTASMWEKVKHNRFETFTVSVDAASAPTYEYVRKGGSWERLIANLERISALREQNVIKGFYLNFLVLQTNHREILDFAELAIRLKCDSAIFQKVSGLLDVRENIYFTRDMEALSLVGTLLNDPIFSDPRINITEVEFCRQYAGRRVSAADRLRTKLTILLFTLPMRIYYRIRYGFAPAYFLGYKYVRKVGNLFIRK